MHALGLHAQVITEHMVPTMPAGVVFDGRVSPEEYAGAIALDLQYEIQPGTNTPAPYPAPAMCSELKRPLVGFICQFDPRTSVPTAACEMTFGTTTSSAWPSMSMAILATWFS
jgi:hypothetical protein